jgi:hypothetical protein
VPPKSTRFDARDLGNSAQCLLKTPRVRDTQAKPDALVIWLLILPTILRGRVRYLNWAGREYCGAKMVDSDNMGQRTLSRVLVSLTPLKGSSMSRPLDAVRDGSAD